MIVLVGLPIVGITEAGKTLQISGGLALSDEVFDKVMDIFVGVLMTGLILASIAVAGRWFDRRRLAEFGFQLNSSWWKQWSGGVCLGLVLMTIIFGVEWLAGWVSIDGYMRPSSNAIPVLLAFVYPVVKACCVSVYEEALSRGYHVTNLREGFLGVWGLGEKGVVVVAIGLSSLFFGVLHIQNPNASALSVINLVVNGAMLGAAYVATGQLGMSIGLHMAWNSSQGWIFGFPVSGDSEVSSVLHTQQLGPDWLTGGAYGPEGGLLGLAASVLGIVIVIAMRNVLKRDAPSVIAWWPLSTPSFHATGAQAGERDAAPRGDC